MGNHTLTRPHGVVATRNAWGKLPPMASPNNIAELPRIKPGRRGSLHQILAMQHALVGDALAEDTTASARAQVARAWCELEERKRILRGRPLPGSFKPERQRQPRTPAYGQALFSEK
jgi:hypothetical protein